MWGFPKGSCQPEQPEQPDKREDITFRLKMAQSNPQVIYIVLASGFSCVATPCVCVASRQLWHRCLI